MNAPLIWIVFPILVAGVIYTLRNSTRLVKVVGISVCLFLALFAWQIPIGSAIPLGGLRALPTLQLSESLTVFGRQFILTDAGRPVLVIIYLGTALWLIGSTVIDASRLFIPLGLAIAALLTAAISVQPFLYAALLIQMAVLLCVPILSPPGSPVPRGVLRFLVFETLGMILMVFAGWLINRVEINPNDQQLILRTAIMLGLGFLMTMSIFPFSAWIPMVAEVAQPYTAAFVFFTLPEVATLFAFNLFGSSSWILTVPGMINSFLVVGLVMIFGGGFLAIFQDNLGRIFGYAVITEIGLFLVTIGQVLSGAQGAIASDTNLIAQLPLAEFFFALLLPRGLNLAIWALALAIIQSVAKDLNFSAVRGAAFRAPVAVISLCLASFSLAGFPLLAGYPVRAVLGIGIAAQSAVYAALTLVGYFGIIVATLRSIAILVSRKEEETWRISESRAQLFLLGVGGLVLVFTGLFPQFFLSGLNTLFP